MVRLIVLRYNDLMNHADYFVDLVDEHGRAIGQKRRRDIDKRRDLYHGVFVLMTTPRGELVLGGIVEREDLPNIYAHKLGATVGAIRRHNETAEQAAKRALKRELFMKKPHVTLLGEGPANLDGKPAYLTAYTTVGLPPMEYSTVDLEELKIVSTDQFEEDLAAGPGQFAPTLRHIWRLYHDQIPQARN
jgi:hypothetical protein